MQLTLVRDHSTEPSRSGAVEFPRARLTSANTLVADGGCDLVCQAAGRWCRPRRSLTHSPVPPPNPHSGPLVYRGLSPPSPPSHSLFSCPYPELLAADCGYGSPQRSHTRPRVLHLSKAAAATAGSLHHITTLIFFFLFFLYDIFKRQYLLYCEFAVGA